MKSQSMPHACLAFACLLWGANFITSKILVTNIDPFLINAIRWPCAAVLIFSLYFQQMKKDWKIVKSNFKTYVILAFFGQTCNQLLLTIGLQHSSVVNAIVWMSTAPAFILIFNLIFFGQRINKIQFFGLIVSAGGVAFLMTHGNLSKFRFYSGDEYFILAAVSWGLYCCLLKRKNPALGDQSFVGFSALIASFFINNPPFKK